jgi:hypothetical protein
MALLVFLAGNTLNPVPVNADGCDFVLGFRVLRDLIPTVVGACLENEHHNPDNGDGLQRTTGGLLVWRKCDNFSAFTDGFRTWINGPSGLVTRLNLERFAWENDRCSGATHDASNLETAVTAWDVPHCEITSQTTPCSNIFFDAATLVPAPDRAGQALRLALNGGPGYSNVLYRRKVSDYPSATNAHTYQLDLDFLYRPSTSFNNQNGRISGLEALEFALTIWRAEPSDGKFRIYDTEIQLLVVRNQPALPPVWQVLVGGSWVPTGVPAYVAGDQWHHLTLNAAIAADATQCDGFVSHYRSFAIDGQVYPLASTTCPLSQAWQSEQVANVNVQLDGNYRTDSVETFLSGVKFAWGY